MKCPTCQMRLDDTLDFGSTAELCCPACGREFSAREIADMPIEDARMSYQVATRVTYHTPWYLYQIPQWV